MGLHSCKPILLSAMFLNSIDKSQRNGHLAMLLFSILVAGSFSFGGLISNLVAPTAINALRFFIAAIVLGAYLFLNRNIGRKDFLKLTYQPWRFAILGGSFGIYFVLMFESLKTTSAISASTIYTLVPIMSAILSYFILKQIATKRITLALFIAACGALWVIFDADINKLLEFNLGRGEIIFFIGCIAHALYIPLVRFFHRGEIPTVATFAVIAWACIFIMAFGLNDILEVEWLVLPLIFWLVLLYVAILASALTFFLIQYATLRLPSAKVMAYTYLTPAWVVIIDGLMGKDLPSGYVLFGFIAIAIALLMLFKDEEKQA